MVPMPPRTFDMVAVPGEASAKARHSALPGEYGPRKVELTARKASMLRTGACFDRVGEEAVDHVHDAAEHGGADGLPLRLVGGAGPHLVERLGRRAHVEAADGPGRGLGPGRHLGHAEHRLDPDRLAEVLEQPLGIASRAGSAAARPRRCWPTGPRARRWGRRRARDPRRSRSGRGTGWTRPARSGSRGSARWWRPCPPMKWFFSRHRTRRPPRAMTVGGGQAVVAGPDHDGVVVRHRLGL